MEKRYLAISDIHGEIDKFEQLLEQTKFDSERDQLILLGDYIDRGTNSKAVIEKVMGLKESGSVVLKGNHEDMMEKAFEHDDNIGRWMKNGGGKTLLSYGVEESTMASGLTILNPLREHLAFIKKLDHYFETDDYIFVHAGVEPALSLSSTDPYRLMWIRDEFHAGYNGNKIVIFGHTPTITFQESHDIYIGSNNIIGIDGGCVFGGRLNCLELPSRMVYYVE